jgi:hypothetical protein
VSNTGLLFIVKLSPIVALFRTYVQKNADGCGEESSCPGRFIIGERAFGIYRISRGGEEEIYSFLGLETPAVQP